MYDPPPGYEDALADCAVAVCPPPSYQPVEVAGVGTVSARRPLPNSVAALAMAANSKIALTSRLDYLVLFVRNHLQPGEMERLYVQMITGDCPPDTMERVARAVATWGTARPTQPSSRSAC